MTDPLDRVLQSACPTVAMPRFGSLPPLAGGQRLVLGANGVFVQLVTPWLDCCLRAGSLEPGVRVPYGSLEEHIRVAFGAVPTSLVNEFLTVARASLPFEVAAGIVYNRSDKTLTLRVHGSDVASRTAVQYRIAALAAGELLVVDLHSHGALPALWSAVDDADDQGIRICAVLGNVDRDIPSARYRLALNGMFRTLAGPWSTPTPEG